MFEFWFKSKCFKQHKQRCEQYGITATKTSDEPYLDW